MSFLFSAYYCAYYRPSVTKNVPVLSLTSLVARCRTWGLCFSQRSNSTSMYVECGEWKWYAYILNIRARLNIKTVFPCIGRDSRYKDNTVARPCCLSDGNAYIFGKTTSWFWSARHVSISISRTSFQTWLHYKDYKDVVRISYLYNINFYT